MKLIMTLLVRDEEDILQANIDFHLSLGVDFIIATDNLSADSTPSILKSYQAMGKLKYILEEDDNYSQHAWVTRMARMARLDYGADWVINNDADEFWWPRFGDLKSTFSSIPREYNVLQAERHNLVPRLETDKDLPFYATMTYQEVESLNPVGKPLPPKQAHIGHPEVAVRQGNHRMDDIGKQRVIHDLIDIYHYPIRSYAQIENRIVQLGAALARNTELDRSLGGARRDLYEEYSDFICQTKGE